MTQERMSPMRARMIEDMRIRGLGDTHEFIRRFLIHIPRDGFYRIRHYGLLASATAKPTSRRSAHYSVRERQGRKTHPLPRSSRSPCLNHARIAVAPCASSKPSGVARFQDPANLQGKRPHERVSVQPIRHEPVDPAKLAEVPCPQRSGKPSRGRSTASIPDRPRANPSRTSRAAAFKPNTNPSVAFTDPADSPIFPIAGTQTPRLPPLEVCQRGPQSNTADTPRNRPRRKTFITPGIGCVWRQCPVCRRTPSINMSWRLPEQPIRCRRFRSA